MNYNSYDTIVGEQMECVLAGPTALYRAGLTSQQTVVLDIWTSYEDIPNGLFAVFVRYYYNPMGKDIQYTVCGKAHKNIHEPTKERALVETIKFHDYFNEGILIEALQNYIRNVEDFSLLYEVAEYFSVSRDDVDYWINEAREESDMSMD